jgi:phosphoadenosine phosphosulfate reductase family protein
MEGICMGEMKKDIIGWWSGGVTSAVACYITSQIYGLERMRFVFIDTGNEDEDTYRFLEDCEKWYGKPIERIRNFEYAKIQDVWYKYNSLNVANGAICSSELKRAVRLKFQAENPYEFQVFGFDIDEPKRARAMKLNYPEANPIFTLLLYGYSKPDCINILQQNGIEIPRAYKLGLNNNNCLKTGCVQGGVGYWQWMAINLPLVFDEMAKVEHELTDRKGKPVTMLKDQSKGGGLVFLKPHPNYPDVKDISMMQGRPPKPLIECNGFCGIDDLSKRSETEKEINYVL